MSQESVVGNLIAKRDEVVPQMYFVVSVIIGLICGISIGILLRMLVESLGPAQVVVIGLLCGFIVGFSFSAFKLNDAVAGGITALCLGIGLGLALGAIVIVFALFFSLGATLGLGIGYGIRRLHYRKRSEPTLLKNKGCQPLPPPPIRGGGACSD